MPKIHEYKTKKGFYIKASSKGRITTYQVTGEGYDYLESEGYTDKSEIDFDLLMRLKDIGYVYTKGTGPGLIATEPISNKTSYVNSNHGVSPATNNNNNNNNNTGCAIGCMVIIAIFFLLSLCSRI